MLYISKKICNRFTALAYKIQKDIRNTQQKGEIIMTKDAKRISEQELDKVAGGARRIDIKPIKVPIIPRKPMVIVEPVLPEKPVVIRKK